MGDTGAAGKEMAKLLGSNNTFIQNITNNNIIGSGNTYNTLVQNKLDLGPEEIEAITEAEGMALSEVMKTLQSLSLHVGTLTSQMKWLLWLLPLALAIIAIIVALK